jgi:hypothetical protein
MISTPGKSMTKSPVSASSKFEQPADIIQPAIQVVSEVVKESPMPKPKEELEEMTET